MTPAPSASAPTGGDEIESSSSDDGEAITVALGVTGGVAAGILLLVIVVTAVLATVLVVGAVMRRRRSPSISKLVESPAEGFRKGSMQEVQLGSVIGKAGQNPLRPAAPRPPGARPAAPAPPSGMQTQWGPASDEKEELPDYDAVTRASINSDFHLDLDAYHESVTFSDGKRPKSGFAGASPLAGTLEL